MNFDEWEPDEVHLRIPPFPFPTPPPPSFFFRALRISCPSPPKHTAALLTNPIPTSMSPCQAEQFQEAFKVPQLCGTRLCWVRESHHHNLRV